MGSKFIPCLAIAFVLCLVPSTSEGRTIEFEGRQWVVKSGYGGPGPNYWSDSEQSVWVDAAGLHLKIRKVGITWYCAEVYSEEVTQHGMHRFYVDGRVDLLDKNVVLGLFLYANDNEEIDIEFARWGASSGTNAQFVVQPPPYYEGVNINRFNISLNGTYSTHYFDWQNSFINFKSFHGHYEEPPDSGYLIDQWTYTGGNNPPESSNLRIHMNLWLYQGNAPSDGQEVEIVIKRADFPSVPDTTPPDPNPMTWATEPYQTGTSSISMVAITANDPTLPILYYFEFYSSPTGGAGGTSLGWQSSTTYTNSGLSANHQYGYRVKAKDGNNNETSYSSPVSYEYTDIETPSGITFGTITATSIQAKSSNTPSGLTRGSSGLRVYNTTRGTNSGWKQNNNYWTSGSLSVNAQYGFRAKARNGDGDETAYCSTEYKYTLANPPGAASFSNITTNSIQANWTSNGNPPGTQYYCENITASTNSGWTTNTYWNSTGLSSATAYSFRVKTRNGDGVETGWTDLGFQMTHYSPVISTIEPNSGPVGTYMKIEGQYFYDSGSVIFTGGATGEILQWSDTTVYCRVPEGALSGNVIVQTTADSNPVNFTITDPTTIYVDDDHIENIENGTMTYPFSEIQRGIDVATSDDEAKVAEGRYYENINFNGKNITVTSLDPNDPNVVETTIIDGNQAGSVVTFNNGEDANCILTGFTITNGYADDQHYGGGIYCGDSSPIILNCIISGNSAYYYGGGIDCLRSDAEIVNCIITNNSAKDGGGICIDYNSPTIDNCIIMGNEASAYGGGISCFTCSPIITNNIINDNLAYDNGGGILCFDTDASISDCNISSNYASENGGGLYCRFGEPNIVNNIISDCFASFGAGIYSISSSPKILNNEIFSNVATYGGGGIFCYDGEPMINNNWITYNYHSGIYSYESSPTISNNLIAGNEGFLSGGISCDANSAVIIKNNTIVENWGQDSGGLGLDTGSTATVINSIIWDNFTDSNENQISMFYDEYFVKQTILDINYSDVEHGFEDVYLQDSNCILTWGTGNISTDPCFVEKGLWDANSVWWEGDYHLLSNSSCIDTGDPNYPEDANEFDIDGDSRIIGGRIDIGADEYTFGELSDFSGNGIVNFEDFAILAYYWQDYVCENPDWCEGCDYNHSGVVDANDLMRFAENWLWRASWYEY